MSVLRKSIVVFLIAIAVIYGAAAAALYAMQRPLLFRNDKTDMSPPEAGLSGIEVHALTTSDGVRLVSWFARGGDRLAIYFHGNGGALAWRGDRIRQLRDLGLSVLAVDYRGFGGSEGSPSEDGLNLDADAVYDFALKLGFSPKQIMLYGESLGTGVAVSLATRREVGALILDAAYSSIADVAAARYRAFPIRYLIRDPFRSDLRIGRITVPILLLHGSDDNVVPVWSGRRLAAQAGANATFLEIPGGHHVVLGEQDAMKQVRVWLAATLPVDTLEN